MLNKHWLSKTTIKTKIKVFISITKPAKRKRGAGELNDNRVSSSGAFAILAHGTKLGKRENAGTARLFSKSKEGLRKQTRVYYELEKRGKRRSFLSVSGMQSPSIITAGPADSPLGSSSQGMAFSPSWKEIIPPHKPRAVDTCRPFQAALGTGILMTFVMFRAAQEPLLQPTMRASRREAYKKLTSRCSN